MSQILIALLDVDYLSILHLRSDTGQGGKTQNTVNTICLVPTDQNRACHRAPADNLIFFFFSIGKKQFIFWDCGFRCLISARDNMLIVRMLDIRSTMFPTGLYLYIITCYCI